MIRPTRYLDISTCVLRVSSIILTQLIQYQVIQLDELKQIVISKLGSDSRFNFTNALGLLYLIGKIDYDLDSDAIHLLS